MQTHHNAYSVSVVIRETPMLVFSLLKNPQTQSYWNKDVQVVMPALGLVKRGTRYMEKRNLLFLRRYCTVEVFELDNTSCCITTRLDDGYNCVFVKTCVSPHPANYGHSIVTQTVSCFRCGGGQLTPSETLACMWRKFDGTLLRLRDYLQPCCPEALAAGSSNVPGSQPPTMMLAV